MYGRRDRPSSRPSSRSQSSVCSRSTSANSSTIGSRRAWRSISTRLPAGSQAVTLSCRPSGVVAIRTRDLSAESSTSPRISGPSMPVCSPPSPSTAQMPWCAWAATAHSWNAGRSAPRSQRMWHRMSSPPPRRRSCCPSRRVSVNSGSILRPGSPSWPSPVATALTSPRCSPRMPRSPRSPAPGPC